MMRRKFINAKSCFGPQVTQDSARKHNAKFKTSQKRNFFDLYFLFYIWIFFSNILKKETFDRLNKIAQLAYYFYRCKFLSKY